MGKPRGKKPLGGKNLGGSWRGLKCHEFEMGLGRSMNILGNVWEICGQLCETWNFNYWTEMGI